MMIDKRIVHYKKENARLFALMNRTQIKSSKDVIIKTINEHEAVIHELEYIKRLSMGGVSNSVCGFVSNGYRPPCYMDKLHTCQNCEHKKQTKY